MPVAKGAKKKQSRTKPSKQQQAAAGEAAVAVPAAVEGGLIIDRIAQPAVKFRTGSHESALLKRYILKANRSISRQDWRPFIKQLDKLLQSYDESRRFQCLRGFWLGEKTLVMLLCEKLAFDAIEHLLEQYGQYLDLTKTESGKTAINMFIGSFACYVSTPKPVEEVLAAACWVERRTQLLQALADNFIRLYRTTVAGSARDKKDCFFIDDTTGDVREKSTDEMRDIRNVAGYHDVKGWLSKTQYNHKGAWQLAVTEFKKQLGFADVEITNAMQQDQRNLIFEGLNVDAFSHLQCVAAKLGIVSVEVSAQQLCFMNVNNDTLAQITDELRQMPKPITLIPDEWQQCVTQLKASLADEAIQEQYFIGRPMTLSLSFHDRLARSDVFIAAQDHEVTVTGGETITLTDVTLLQLRNITAAVDAVRKINYADAVGQLIANMKKDQKLMLTSSNTPSPVITAGIFAEVDEPTSGASSPCSSGSEEDYVLSV